MDKIKVLSRKDLVELAKKQECEIVKTFPNFKVFIDQMENKDFDGGYLTMIKIENFVHINASDDLVLFIDKEFLINSFVSDSGLLETTILKAAIRYARLDYKVSENISKKTKIFDVIEGMSDVIEGIGGGEKATFSNECKTLYDAPEEDFLEYFSDTIVHFILKLVNQECQQTNLPLTEQDWVFLAPVDLIVSNLVKQKQYKELSRYIAAKTLSLCDD